MNHSWYEILNTKEISVHVHVPLYCSLGPIPMTHTFQLQIDPSSHQHPASIQKMSQILFSLGYSHTWRIPDATDGKIEQNIMKPKIFHKLIYILQSILEIPHLHSTTTKFNDTHRKSYRIETLNQSYYPQWEITWCYLLIILTQYLQMEFLKPLSFNFCMFCLFKERK